MTVKTLTAGETFQHDGKLWQFSHYTLWNNSNNSDVIYPVVWGRRWIKKTAKWSGNILLVCRANKITE